MIEKRYLDDESSFADYASWLDAHGLKEDRRRRNIITECNHVSDCCCYDEDDDWSEK